MKRQRKNEAPAVISFSKILRLRAVELIIPFARNYFSMDIGSLEACSNEEIMNLLREPFFVDLKISLYSRKPFSFRTTQGFA